MVIFNQKHLATSAFGCKNRGFFPGWKNNVLILHYLMLLLQMIYRSLNISTNANSTYVKSVVLKPCIATPWCVISIFQGRRTKANSVQFYALN